MLHPDPLPDLSGARRLGGYVTAAGETRVLLAVGPKSGAWIYDARLDPVAGDYDVRPVEPNLDVEQASALVADYIDQAERAGVPMMAPPRSEPAPVKLAA